MLLMQKKIGLFPLGILLALAALVMLCLAWAMQAYSLLDWNGALALGVQNESFDGDPVARAWAQESWGVAAADIVWAMPITVFALFGILRSRFYGLVLGFMAFAIGIYFPLVFAFQRWNTFRGTAITALCLWTVPCLVGVAGLWGNRRRFVD